MGSYDYESSVYSVKNNGTNHYVYIPLKDGLVNAASKIPPQAYVTKVTLYVYADTSTASNDAILNLSLTNSNGSTTYLNEFSKNNVVDGNGSSITNYSVFNIDVTSWFNILGANSGELNGYGGNDTYIKCHFKLYTLTNYTWAAKIKLSFEWADPRANISVTSNIGEDCVSTTKDYILYGESATITANEVQGYHFVKWSDGNTNASRTITLNDAFLATYQKHITDLDYEAVYEKKPPEFTSASMTYLNKQISSSNKVICKEGFIISVAVT
jgi:hypothetical protein